MNNSRKKLASLLKKNKRQIIHKWSSNIFKVPGHLRYKDIMPRQMHASMMSRYVNALINDIRQPGKRLSFAVAERLVLKSYLGVNTAEDIIHGQIILRGILLNILVRTYRKEFRRLKEMTRIIISEIDKNILCYSRLFKLKNFARLKTMIRYGKRLMYIHDMNRLYGLMLEAALKESNSDRGSIMLLDKDGYLRIKASVGIPKTIVANVKQRPGSGIAGKVVKTGRPLVINKGQILAPGIRRKLRGLGEYSAASIPIVAESSVIGALNLLKYKSKQFFNETDVEMLVMFAYEAGAAISNSRLFDEVHDLYTGSIISFAAAIDARDHYTHGHSSNVAKLATSTARRLGMPQEAIKNIYYASMLHDIGKIGIPDNILLKPGKLTRKEFEIVKKHPIYAVKILKHIPRMKQIIPIIFHEHEHYNGKGYVKGLKGEEIPLGSRIIAVADAYEAMTSNRPYRASMPKKNAIREIKRCSGDQFDPKVVRTFLQVVRK